MKEGEARPLTLAVGESGGVSALWLAPAQPRACYVFAHGAGAGMTTRPWPRSPKAWRRATWPRCASSSRTWRRARSGPTRRAVAQAAVRAAVAEAARLGAGLPLFAGGRSFGGRMTSQAQAKAPLLGVRGLAFVGFPLHPAGRPGTERAAHLSSIDVPMLFLQGTRDELASLDLLHPVLDALGAKATLELIDDADHSFHVRARSGRNDAQVREAMLDATVAWMATIAAR